ncbi:MAG: SHOCT domain-containing protein [Proteobacteria bacterium]|nr:SHOCT domain-containing protein [Pseudomonadota bacterium]
MKKVVNFATVFFLFSMFVGCAGLKSQMREIQGSENKKFSYTHAELILEFKVPVKVTEIRQYSYRFTGSGMPNIFVHVLDQQLPSGYTYNSLDWYAKSINAIVFDTVKPDGFEWREGIQFYKNSPTLAGVGYVTRKHNKLIMVGYDKYFTNEEISEIKALNYKNKVLFSAFSELDSWVRIIIKDKGQVRIVDKDKENPKTSWKETSEKIEKLGELYNKGLITKEEYEVKKKSLLQSY